MSELSKESSQEEQSKNFEDQFSEHATNLNVAIKTVCSRYVHEANAQGQRGVAVLSFASSWACAMVAAEAAVAACVIAGHDLALGKEYMSDLKADMDEVFARKYPLVSDQFKQLAAEEAEGRLRELEKSEQGEK